MNGSIRNKLIIFLFALLAASCNLPAADQVPADSGQLLTLWDLSRPAVSSNTAVPTSPAEILRPTATPQLYKAIDFNSAFSTAIRMTDSGDRSGSYGTGTAGNFPEAVRTDETGNSVQSYSMGEDKAQWLYFEPAEYSVQPIDTLYAVFKNSGTRQWDERYYLDFFAGVDPTGGKSVHLNKNIAPGDQAVFEIPIQSAAASWKSCWQLKNAGGEIIYEFCYNHGTGDNSPNTSSAQANTSSSGSGELFWGFVKTNGKAPARISTEELSAEFVSTTPASQHTFKAYDHTENFSVSFVNRGTKTWDPSYSLKFYSGYNWFHTDSVSLPQTVAQGETVTITMPIEIIEDNDKWVTCWYLSTPDGQNLSDFCFNYYTKS